MFAPNASSSTFWITAASRIAIAIVIGVIYRVARTPRRVRVRED